MSEARTFPKGDGTFALLRCPNNHENYAPAVMSGKCAFCDYDANSMWRKVLPTTPQETTPGTGEPKERDAQS